MTESARLQQGFVDRLAPEPPEASRRVSWIFSNEDVCLDFHTIKTAGWELDDYQRNPVLLFAHDQSAPPIGRVTRIEKRGPLLVGDSEFADAETYPFADTVFRLVKGGFLNAVSVSWFPLEFKPARDKSRPDGVDFTRQKLLEISVVPVPANPTALATARDAGIDVRPIKEWAACILDGLSLRELSELSGGPMTFRVREIRAADLANCFSAHGVWRDLAPALHQGASMSDPARAARDGENFKCGASRNLPLDEDSEWDGAAAAKSIFEACGFDGDKPDLAKARKGFLAYDAKSPKLKGSYKLPFARVKNGRMTALASGIRAAASRLPQTDIPEDVQDQARAVIDHYEGKMKKDKGDRAATSGSGAGNIRQAGTISKRGLYEVANLAYYLSSLGYIKARIDREEAEEGDTDSPSPENMAAVLQAVGKALVEMAAEEVEELLDLYGPMEGLGDGARAAPGKLALARAAKLTKTDRAGLEDIHDHCTRSARLVRTHIDHYQGEDLSDDDTRAEMFDHAEAIHDHCMRSAEKLRAHIDGHEPPADGGDGDGKGADGKPGDGDDGARAARAIRIKDDAAERRKEAAKLRARSLIED